VSESELPLPHKDRYVGLVLFGAFELLIGGFLLLMAPLTLLGWFMSQQFSPEAAAQQGTLGQMIAGASFYVLLAVFFLAMAWGSLLARRWVRPLMLSAAWLWLIIGVVAMAAVIILAPWMDDLMMASMELSGQPAPPGFVDMMPVILIFMIATTSCLYVFIPGAFVLFYQSKHVKATLELRDLTPRWSDQCPTPVFAVAHTLVILAFSALMMCAYNGVFPLFGIVVTGIPGLALDVAVAFVLVYLAWGCCLLKPSAWWTTVVISILATASMCITILLLGPTAYFEAMNMPSQQIAMMEGMPLMSVGGMIAFTLLNAVIWFAYLVWVKKYFTPTPPDAQLV
jgi:hypothetical protein